MIPSTLLITILLRCTFFAFAAPANDLPSLAINTANSIYPNPNSPQNQPSTNGTGVISYPVDNTPITLLITPIPNQKISRTDLVMTLYDSREYLKLHIKQRGNSRLQGSDNPFSSTKIPNPPQGNCVVEAQNGGPLKELTYRFLGDAIQGLMDYTFFPYSAEVDSFTFQVSHSLWGIIGTGSLKPRKASTDSSAATA